MYQSNKTNNYTEEDFAELMELFKADNIGDVLTEDDQEYDLESIYAPNHACIWNKPSAIGKRCKILQKDSQVARVLFLEVPKDLTRLEHTLYRLEDLELLEKITNYIHKGKFYDEARELINSGQKLRGVKLIYDKREDFGLKQSKEFADFEIFKENQHD